LSYAHEIYTLGGFRAQHISEPLTDLASRKALALLAYLGVTGTPQSRDHLAALLWPERSQTRARGNLRVALSTASGNSLTLFCISNKRTSA
jgi:DNA-binding SARP family transcriptional activator